MLGYQSVVGEDPLAMSISWQSTVSFIELCLLLFTVHGPDKLFIAIPSLDLQPIDTHLLDHWTNDFLQKHVSAMHERIHGSSLVTLLAMDSFPMNSIHLWVCLVDVC